MQFCFINLNHPIQLDITMRYNQSNQALPTAHRHREAADSKSQHNVQHEAPKPHMKYCPLDRSNIQNMTVKIDVTV